MTITKRATLLLAVAALASIASTAAAEEKQTPGPIEIKVQISLRVPRPMAAIDVARVLPARPLSELRRTFVDRIEHAAAQPPF